MPSSSTTSATTAAAPLIKGYLPVRLRLPPAAVASKRGSEDDGSGGTDGRHGQYDDTFFFVREHRGKPGGKEDGTTVAAEDDAPQPAGGGAATPAKPGTTLFVANAPTVPGISTKILLRSIFGRFADVTRVTVVQNPRGGGGGAGGGGEEAGAPPAGDNSGLASPFVAIAGQPVVSAKQLGFSSDDGVSSFFYPSFLPPVLSEGKYAHVVFASQKDMKKAKKALEDVMVGRTAQKRGGKSKSSKRRSKHGKDDDKVDDDDDDDDLTLPPALSLDKIEIQTLSDETLRQWDEHRRKVLRGSRDSGNDDDDDDGPSRTERPTLTGLMAVARQYRESCEALSRDRLLQECDAVMEAYEEADEARRRVREAARTQPDEDGFVTVTYSGAAVVGSKIDLEESLTATTPSRRKGNKRNRKKKEAAGSIELHDFYRFQRRDNRKRSMDDLRKQFDEDLKRVKRLKEEKQYRPF